MDARQKKAEKKMKSLYRHIVDVLITFVIILLQPIVWIALLIFWIRTPNKQKFCKHEWKEEILPATMGLFGGAVRKTCVKCGKQDDSESWGRVDRLNRSYK